MSKVLYTLLELRYLWKQKGNKNYKLKDILMKGDFAERLIFEDATNHRLVSGKIVYSSNEGENYHWPKLKHENLAPLIDIVSLNEHQSVFISLPVEQSLSEIINSEHFINNPNCIDRKKAYAEDILWGLDYLHKKQLCLMNLSDKNISIQMLSDKAVIFDFSDLKCAELVKKNQMCLKDFYHAPELYCHVSEKFDAIGAEIWACGEMFLSMFTNHLKLIKSTGEKVSNALEIVEALDAKLLTLANPSVFISKAFVFDFKIFLCLFLQNEPVYRITARNAAISTFLSRTNQRKNEDVNRLWELYDNQELKERELHHSFNENQMEVKTVGKYEQTSLQSNLESHYWENNNLNPIPIENDTKAPLWDKINNANVEGLVTIKKIKNSQAKSYDVKNEIPPSSLQRCKSLQNLSISHFARSTTLDKLFNEMSGDQNCKKQDVCKNCNSLYLSACETHMLNKEIQTDISVQSFERIQSITILEQFPEMMKEQNVQMIRFRVQKSSSDSNLHNLNLGKNSFHYSFNSQTDNFAEYLQKYGGNFRNGQTTQDSSYTAQNSFSLSKNFSFSSGSFIPSKIKGKECIEKSNKTFEMNKNNTLSSKNQYFLSHQEIDTSFFTTLQLRNTKNNNSIENRQTNNTSSRSGDLISPSFTDFKRISQNTNYLNDNKEGLDEENCSKNKIYQGMTISRFRNPIDENKTANLCHIQSYLIGDGARNISQSDSQFLPQKLELNEISVNTKAESFLKNHDSTRQLASGEVVELPSVKPKSNNARETALNASCAVFDNTDYSIVQKKCFGKCKDGKKKRKLQKIWLPSWWRKRFRKIRKKRRNLQEETDYLTESTNKTDF